MRKFSRITGELRTLERTAERLFVEYEQARADAQTIGIEANLILGDYLQAALSAFRRAREDAELKAHAKELVSAEYWWPIRGESE